MFHLPHPARTAAVMCVAFASMAGPARATRPLSDQIWYNGRAGTVYQLGKGAIALPPSAQLRAMMIAEASCSAHGGPRGVYKTGYGKLWLAGLHRCSGAIGLGEAYPGMTTPPLADWITGVLVAHVGRYLCTSTAGKPIHDFEVQLTVASGVVIAADEKAGDTQACVAAKTD